MKETLSPYLKRPIRYFHTNGRVETNDELLPRGIVPLSRLSDESVGSHGRREGNEKQNLKVILRRGFAKINSIFHERGRKKRRE